MPPSTSCSSSRSSERGPHLGRALDLGCGTGERTGHLVERGWDAVGIDNVRQAVDIAVRRSGVADTRFVIGDVRHLVHSGIGSDFSLVLDVGCFEGLGDDDRALVAAGVTQLAAPDATMLLMTTQPPALTGAVPRCVAGGRRAGLRRLDRRQRRPRGHPRDVAGTTRVLTDVVPPAPELTGQRSRIATTP